MYKLYMVVLRRRLTRDTRGDMTRIMLQPPPVVVENKRQSLVADGLPKSRG